MSYLMAGMFECHEKSCFDVTAISLGPDDNSKMRQRLKASFERFIDAKTYSDDQIVNLVRSSEIDILVDLMGFIADARTKIFARRPAPIQVNYLGYPGTMGASYIDYIVADQTVIPDGFMKFYSEKIAVLPNTYLANDRKRVISDKAFTNHRCDFAAHFAFLLFNLDHLQPEPPQQHLERSPQGAHGIDARLRAQADDVGRSGRSSQGFCISIIFAYFYISLARALFEW